MRESFCEVLITLKLCFGFWVRATCVDSQADKDKKETNVKAPATDEMNLFMPNFV